MAGFKRGDTVRRVANGEDCFPDGATALVIAPQNSIGYVRISADAENDGWLIGETWSIPATDLELVTPAPVAQPVRKIVQRDVSAIIEGGLAHTLWFEDGSFAVNDIDGDWLLFPAPPIPQEPTP